MSSSRVKDIKVTYVANSIYKGNDAFDVECLVVGYGVHLEIFRIWAKDELGAYIKARAKMKELGYAV